MIIKIIALIILLGGTQISYAKSILSNPLYIAVSANFYSTLKLLSKNFNQQTGIEIKISTGSTGLLFSQINAAAPYDIFFSADTRFAKLLEQNDKIEPNSRVTYAFGELVVWSPNPHKVTPDLTRLLPITRQLQFIAIANPKVAPYGKQAVKVLRSYKLLPSLKQKIVFASNIAQAYQYTASGHTQLGVIAYSYAVNLPKNQIWHIPKNLYKPIEQQLVVLKGHLTPAVKKFLLFLKSDKAKKIITQSGYRLSLQGKT